MSITSRAAPFHPSNHARLLRRLIGRMRRAAAVAGLICLAACPQKTAVWVEPGSSASHLVLGIADSRGRRGPVAIGAIRVYECGGDDSGPGAMWVVGPRGGTADIRRIVYGTTPPGFVSDQGPRALTPGCYRVEISGTGSTEFTVDAKGAVTEHAATD